MDTLLQPRFTGLQSRPCLMYSEAAGVSGLVSEANAIAIATINTPTGSPIFKNFVFIKNDFEMTAYYFLQVFGLPPETRVFYY